MIYHNRSFFTFRGKKAAFDCGYLGCVIKFMCISIGVTVMVYEFIKERRKIYAGFYVL